MKLDLEAKHNAEIFRARAKDVSAVRMLKFWPFTYSSTILNEGYRVLCIRAISLCLPFGYSLSLVLTVGG